MRRLGLTIIKVATIAMAVTPVASQTPEQRPAFDVASIKKAVFPSEAFFLGYVAGAGPCGQARISVSGNRVTLSPTSICGLISSAYDLRGYLIVGAPSWMTSTDPSLIYEIQANAPEALGAVTVERAREMLQTLLADRFQLKVHRETRELPVYALVVAKNGPKLSLSGKGPCSKVSKNATLAFSFSTGRGPRQISSCQPKTSIAQLAQSLTRETDRPVVDQTGIEGGQVFELQWSAGAIGTEPDSDPLPSLFTAVQEQLGLKLEATNALVEVLVIDSVQRPTEN
jgi:uncharacterized protein (TIGR03435 family)